ncbi:unnamed protein product [Protopolystoma xenopodis]|uniref:Uncharacterized protein n=1 Tax=Protopolystoma xenopodis TaxID=117903 RepID=A0A3S5CPU4_9PLAT|nr:unnamed protein product [Protopolystoma xenopodis]
MMCVSGSSSFRACRPGPLESPQTELQLATAPSFPTPTPTPKAQHGKGSQVVQWVWLSVRETASPDPVPAEPGREPGRPASRGLAPTCAHAFFLFIPRPLCSLCSPGVAYPRVSPCRLDRAGVQASEPLRGSVAR